MFPFFCCNVKFGLSKQVLTGTTPLNQTYENSFHTHRLTRRQMQRSY